MPTQAATPCRAPLCPAYAAKDGLCELHRREQRARHDADRGSRHERGYDSKWVSARAGYLKKHPKCARCEAPATVVDHIVPHGGDKARFWDSSNWQPLCKPCHDSKTAKEDGRWGRALLPPKLTQSLIPFVVICGPVGAGKKLLVSRLAKPEDLVVDLDALKSKLSGLPLYKANHAEWGEPAMRERNRLLGQLSTAAPVPWPRAWLITGAPAARDRRFWKEQAGARVLLLATPFALCRDNILHDELRDERSKADALEGARSWWTRYTPDPFNDEVVHDAAVATFEGL